ncbi:MAG: hypothetical protein H7Z17_08390 [Fuerstia sp.]|nr:hypothetical protein [Fuerstiella sp.]
MQLPPGYASYLFEEFSQCFCVEQAFDHSLNGITRVMRQTLSREALDRINQRVGWQAEKYLDVLAAPPVEEEGELMILRRLHPVHLVQMNDFPSTDAEAIIKFPV